MKPKICVLNRFPFKGFVAITLCMFIIVRKDKIKFFNDVTYNHEMIHFKQQKEMLFLFFFIWYLIEFLFKSVYYFSFYKGYLNLSFEREAYENDRKLTYHQKRKRYSWFKYIIK